MAEVVILGTAQDGGVPHAGCLCVNCMAARNSGERRLPVSLGIISGDDLAIVDATSAFEEQVFKLWSRTPASKTHAHERFRPPGTVILTHAHTGHYVGLWQLDRSVLSADAVKVLGPPLTIGLLQNNEPWVQMAADGFMTLEPVTHDTPIEPLPGVQVTLIEVPHRSEWATDTAALRIQGPRGSLLYLPDIDSWDAWDRDVGAMVRDVDVALLDGCFWQAPSRAGVPHPPILETMDRLQHLVDARTSRVVFTHLNHSNPAITPNSEERALLDRRGFEIAAEGAAFAL